jgi:single-strand DNA-binding protein
VVIENMACYAKVGLTGRLGKDPKQSTVNNTTVINFSVAVRTTKKKNESYVADFYNVNYWGKAAEAVIPKLKKGVLVQVYGDLQQEEYNYNGETRQSMSVRASDVMVLDNQKPASKKEDSEEEMPF